jgi:hypothetical protein
MNTKTLLVLLFVLTMGSVQPAEAQLAKKIPKIGYSSGSSPSAATPRIDAFRQGLRDFGLH